MAKSISIEDLSDDITKLLNEYVDEIADGTDEAADKVAKQCLKEIKAASPVRTGAYKKGWSKKQTNSGRGKAQFTIYNKKPGLPHLLENGYSIPSTGGRVEGKPHIAPAAEKAVRDFQDAVKGVIEHATGGV